MHFADLIDSKLRLIWRALGKIMKEDIGIDLCLHKEKLEDIGFEWNDGVLCAKGGCGQNIEISSELSTLGAKWLSACVPKYKSLTENGLNVVVCDQRIVVIGDVKKGGVYRPELSNAARGLEDIKREFILLDCNESVSFFEFQQPGVFLDIGHWVTSRMYILLEIKIERMMMMMEEIQIEEKQVHLETMKVVKPRVSRVANNVHESKQSQLDRLRNVYAFSHKPVLFYTSAGVTQNVCCIPVECFNSLGEDGETTSTDITALEAWQRKVKCTFIALVLNNLWQCGDKRLWTMRLDPDPKRAHEVAPAFTENDRQLQIQTNLKLIARTLRWFVGKGKQPKFRTQFFNHDTGKMISGKAAPPWHLILDTFELELGKNGNNLPVRTPVMIKQDAVDPDIEDMLLLFESDPMKFLIAQQQLLLKGMAACNPKSCNHIKKKQKIL